MKVLFEIYDANALLNVVSCWQIHPDLILFFYREEERNLIHNHEVENMLDGTVEYILFNNDTLEEIILKQLEKYPDDNIYFDTHGGENLAISIFSRMAYAYQKTICYSDFTAMKMRFYQCGKKEWKQLFLPKMSVKSYIALSGASVIPEQEYYFQGEEKKTPEIVLALKRQMEGRWDKFCSAISHMELLEPENLYFMKPMDAERCQEAIGYLNSNHFFSVFRKERKGLYLQFANAEYRMLLMTYGLSLEYVVYQQLFDSALFDDVDLRVHVDWNGGKFNSGDPTSELDVMAVWNGVLAVISCKAGELNEQAVYEVKTNAVKFGKTFAVPIICNDKKRISDQLMKKGEELGVLILLREQLKPEIMPQLIYHHMKEAVKR